MKVNKLFAGAAMMVLMASCASDEPATTPSTGADGGEKAYMAVTIKDATSGLGGRSTDYADDGQPNYAYGTDDERAINNANFYFFDEKGNYMLMASMGNPEFGGSTNEDGDQNIEWNSNSILVLEDMTSNTTPKYMLTVLNAPEFKAEATLAETSKALSVFADDASKFVMSTSSYLTGSDITDGVFTYYATELKSSDFYLTPEDAMASGAPVEVFVERLAAKVELSMAVPADETVTLANGKVLYHLAQTVAGGENGDNNGSDYADTDLYVEVIGWGLNATAAKSHISKQLDTKWYETANQPFANWNNATDHRSYWGQAWTYVAEPEAQDGMLAYTNSTKLHALAQGEYCYENTNTAANLFQQNAGGQSLVHNARATHVVLNTRLCDKDGNDIKAVSYRGVLYLEEAFKAYALRTLNNSTAGLNFYRLTGTTTVAGQQQNSYTQVSTGDIELAGIAGTVGEASFKVKAGDLYEKKVVDGEETYVKLDHPELESRLNNLVANDSKLYWYNTSANGGNIYYIPVEHNANTTTKGKEGYYGVVRNHWYKISVNGFSKVGHALFDPDGGSETIKPESPEDPLYYLATTIRILSWRIINQSVDL